MTWLARFVGYDPELDTRRVLRTFHTGPGILEWVGSLFTGMPAPDHYYTLPMQWTPLSWLVGGLAAFAAFKADALAAVPGGWVSLLYILGAALVAELFERRIVDRACTAARQRWLGQQGLTEPTPEMEARARELRVHAWLRYSR